MDEHPCSNMGKEEKASGRVGTGLHGRHVCLYIAREVGDVYSWVGPPALLVEGQKKTSDLMR